MLKTVSTSAITGSLSYQGTWNANTNMPVLTSSVGTQNWYYVVSTAGNTTLNGVSNWNVGDWAIFNGSVWEKVDGSSLGTMAYQNANAVSITGGTINTTTINTGTFVNANITSVSTTFPNSYLANASATIGNTTITLGSTTTSVGNLTLANVIISSGNVSANISGSTGIPVANAIGTLATSNGGTGLTSFTANGVVYASSTSELATGSALTFDGTTLNATSKITAPNLQGPAFSAYGNSIQTLSNNTRTKVAYNTSVFDTNSNYSTSNYRFTPTVAGYYQVNALLYMTLNNITQISCEFSKNGSVYQYFGSQYNNSSYLVDNLNEMYSSSSIIYLNGSTDYLEIYVTVSTSGTTTVNGYTSRPDLNYFNAVLVRSG